MPLKVPSGRIYAFYVYNADNMREVIASTEYARRRVDTLGHYVFKYSDDGGRTWSDERYRVPVRTFAIDRDNPYQGEVQFFWGVGKPIVYGDTAYIGLSKIARIVDYFARRLQIQEVLTKQVAQCVEGAIDAQGVGVVIEAQHMCMMMRGVQKQNSSMTTSCMLGSFRTQAQTREEFLRLI